jgi:topoisomerase-4 subunit A
MDDKEKQEGQQKGKRLSKSIKPVSNLYEDWFLDYASYVILERAVPNMYDGLKPVQRRILHAMKETDDGRFNKVANIIGNTMQYHPHGDASIGDAIVNLGQKDLLIETQGNWGDVVTGDSAAASRYIEARLSKFALEVAFNPDLTEWQSSYDGRKKEPVILPMKFPLLLAQGTEGIAVGLSTKILPHNFNELIKASISYLRNEKFELYPDFPTNGIADFSNYNEGRRGGKVRVRSKIEITEKKDLVIRNVPFGVTTTSLIESIIKANDAGKIKIKQVTDNTARNVEIIIDLPKGVSPDVTIDALYAFTNCEVSISPNACVIKNERPHFMSVHEILEESTNHTVELLKKELEIKRDNLYEKWHFSSLEKIFIEKRVYRDIEECETWESVIETIDEGLKPHIKHLKREVTRDDIIRLTEIKIKRISKFDSFKADELIKEIENAIAEVLHNLEHLIEFAIKYFENLLKKYGKGRERKTEIRAFDNIEAKYVAVANKKLYVNKKEGFFGFGLKKEELVGECSELDDIITFRKDGKYSVSKVDEKVFSGKDIIHIDVFKKDDERMTYNAVYWDGKAKRAMVKRFNVTSVTRDKEYDVTKGHPNSKLLYFTANPLGETETVAVYLSQSSKARKKVFDFDFSEIAIKGRNSQGNILTRYPIRKIVQKSVDTSNIIGIDVWYDESVGKLNTKEFGKYLGNFTPEDDIIAIYTDGTYEVRPFDLTNRYNFETLEHIEMFNPEQPITCIYYNSDYKSHFVKRFQVETSTKDKSFRFIPDNRKDKLILVSTGDKTVIRYSYINEKDNSKKNEHIELSEVVDVMGWKAIGKKLSNNRITGIKLIDIIFEQQEEEDLNQEEITEPTEKADSTDKENVQNDNTVDESFEENRKEKNKQEDKKKQKRG